MSSLEHDTSAEVLRVGEVSEPLLQPAARLTLSRRGAQQLAVAGRAAVVWLPVFTFLAGHIASLQKTLPLSLLIAGVWFLALQGSFAAARLTLLALGPSIAAALGTFTGLIAVSALNLWVPELRLEPTTVLGMALAVFILSAAWEKLVYRSIAATRRVLIVGASNGGSELVEELQLADDTPFEVVGFVDDERETDQVAGVPVHGRLEDLCRIIEAQRPDIVVLGDGYSRPEAFNHLLDVADAGFTVVGLPEFHEHAFGRVPVRHLSVSWFMNVLHLYRRPYTRVAKRVFDIVVAATGLLLTGPLFPVLALLVRRSPGPVIFRQTRLGEGGRPFTIYKFRTMQQDAEASGRAMWADECDPRVTGVGRFMRDSRLDELPQLWNVLKGDMSVVGPRPERPEFLELLSETVPFWTRRHLVKPGITGWAQVRRGYTSDSEGTADKLAYDLWYLRHRSLTIDLAICAKTAVTLLSGSGAR